MARPQAPRFAVDHGVEFEVAEQCLAHAVGNSVTRAYLRTTMLERRRKVIVDWAAFLRARATQASLKAPAGWCAAPSGRYEGNTVEV